MRDRSRIEDRICRFRCRRVDDDSIGKHSRQPIMNRLRYSLVTVLVACFGASSSRSSEPFGFSVQRNLAGSNPGLNVGESFFAEQRQRQLVSTLTLEALTALYVSTQGSGWTTKTNWLQGDPCTFSWTGIVCSGSEVTQLNLGNNNLKGTLPTVLGYLTSMAANAKFNHGNTLSGTLPSELGQWSLMVTSFQTHDNIFTGAIPSQLGLWTGFQNYFEPRLAKFSGKIPSELGLLTNMQAWLAFDGNKMTGEIPSELAKIPNNAAVLRMSQNSLCGDIPPGVTPTTLITTGNMLGTPCCEVPLASVTCSPTSTPSPPPSTQFPTSTPTLSPIQDPTPLPTSHPTPSPTQTPTPLPTSPPSPAPTQDPTPSPTNVPTVSCPRGAVYDGVVCLSW